MPYTWSEFISECKSCDRCSLAKTRNNVVVYRGSPEAPLMFVGEGPGVNEDKQGVPFVGKAGNLLNTLLVAHDFKEKDYHICNIVKCRPPENRVPSIDEAKTCMHLLGKQIRFVKPKIIVLLGGTAYNYFMNPIDTITKAHGIWVEKNGYFILPTFHPAYILRNNKDRIKLWNDIDLVKKKLKQIQQGNGVDE